MYTPFKLVVHALGKKILFINQDIFLADIEKEFKQYVQKFVEATFSPSLCVKQINGREITTIELFEYFKAYCTVFEADELPEPKSMLMATAEANNLAAKAIAKEFFIHAMEQVRYWNNHL